MASIRFAGASVKRSTRSLLESWLAAPSPLPLGAGNGRIASRDALNMNLVASWAAAAAGRRVAPRAASREAHSSDILSSWASEAAPREVQKRAAARDHAVAGLLGSWLVKEGVSKQTPKDAIKRGPLPAAALASRWLIQDGFARVGAESAVETLQHGVRGLYPVSKGDLLRSWWHEGAGEGVRKALRVMLGMGAGLLVATTVGQAYIEASNARARKLMRRGSLAGARLTKKISLR